MKILNIEDRQIQIDKELYTLLKASVCKGDERDYLSKPFYIKSLNKICATDGRVLTLTEELPEPLPPKFLYFNLFKEAKNFYLISMPTQLNATPPNVASVLPKVEDLLFYKNKEHITIPKNKKDFAVLIFNIFNFLGFPVYLESFKPLRETDKFKLSRDEFKVQLEFTSGVLHLIMGIKIED